MDKQRSCTCGPPINYTMSGFLHPLNYYVENQITCFFCGLVDPITVSTQFFFFLFFDPYYVLVGCLENSGSLMKVNFEGSK